MHINFSSTSIKQGLLDVCLRCKEGIDSDLLKGATIYAAFLVDGDSVVDSVVYSSTTPTFYEDFTEDDHGFTQSELDDAEGDDLTQKLLFLRQCLYDGGWNTVFCMTFSKDGADLMASTMLYSIAEEVRSIPATGRITISCA